MSTNLLLLEIARQHFSERALREVEECLLKEDTFSARAHIAGTLEVLWRCGRLTQREAEVAYQKLGLDISILLIFENQTLQ